MEIKKKVSKKEVRKIRAKGPRGKQGKETFLKLLKSVNGAGRGIWKEDAQEYVNRVRDNDRF